MDFCLYLVLFATLAAYADNPGTLSAAMRKTIIAPARVAPANIVPVLRADPRSGQLVRTVVIAPRVVESHVVAPQPVFADPQLSSLESASDIFSGSLEVRNLVAEAAKTHDVSAALVESVIQVESNYNPHAVSPKGAQGLMQLMPSTARRFGVKNSFDPKQNIDGGVRYLKFLRETFGDDRLAVAAYNAGEGAVLRYGNVPPYVETMDYVAKVGLKYGQARRAELAKKKAQVNVEPAAPKPPEFRRLSQHVGADGKVYLSTQ